MRRWFAVVEELRSVGALYEHHPVKLFVLGLVHIHQDTAYWVAIGRYQFFLIENALHQIARARVTARSKPSLGEA